MQDCGDTERAMLDVDRIHAEIRDEGIAVLPGFVATEKLAEIQAFVTAEVARQPATYVGSVGKETVRGSPLELLDVESGLIEVLREVHERLIGARCPDARLYQVLRVLNGGADGERRAHLYHFDAYALTALLAITIPDRADGRNGDLILFRRRRGLHSRVAINLLQKLLAQNPLSRRLLALPTFQRLLDARKVRLVPGHLYIFLGFQTLHGNAPCGAGSLRATALFHYSDPMRSSRLMAALERLNAVRTELRAGGSLRQAR